ncbi:16S rRNA (guanine(527)-N(7))-methyltransferase RsmG [Geofilum sp. OHC36d9]|uniref:16S rRNA (guanine(527)-N(7))-methyltransferase RsmG n=1 Tax=Geofilum sp. OHC36d9 TaxID=3458413 RepID=UPI0040331C98
MEVIQKYFPGLTDEQINHFSRLKDIYSDWNQQINVISRKDMANFYEHHVLHSLAIGLFIKFSPGTTIIDVGTGGGFPGLPLAIMFPEVNFTLIDSIGKKIKVVKAVAATLHLKNVTALQTRAENYKGQFDFIVSRAVTTLPEFYKQTQHLVSPKQKNAITNGILYLKGGDLTDEINPFKSRISSTRLSDYFDEPFFSTKKILHLSF